MKFKFLGITWDFMPLIAWAWLFIGMMCILWVFVADSMPWWMNAIWIVTTIVFVATADEVGDWLMK